ncbi:MAG TPA: hypothetical protein PK990_07040 [Salinivirgaceae bacterium]|nr:hypothetical protein [Salinivirgaceae bacterium]
MAKLKDWDFTMQRRFGTVLFLMYFSLAVFAGDDNTKKVMNQQGLITTMSFGDLAPVNRYIQIISSSAVDTSVTSIFDYQFDSVDSYFFLSNAFCSGCEKKSFRFYKDPYDLYYRIFFDKDHVQCIDVSLPLLDQGYAPSLNRENYGYGQNFYIRYFNNGYYKIYHSSGKILSLNPNPDCFPKIKLIDDNDSPYSYWFFIDPVTKKVLTPKNF